MKTPTNKEVAALMTLKEWKLWGKALKAMPSSPKQKALLQELNELRLARGVHPITNY